MSVLVAALAASTALLLAWTGAVKVLGRSTADGLTALLRNARRASVALRALGVVEIGIALALVVAPRAGGAAAGVLGLGFLAYLAAAGRAAPGTGCGCAGGAAPIGRRTYARASAVTAAGVITALGGRLLAGGQGASGGLGGGLGGLLTGGQGASGGLGGGIGGTLTASPVAVAVCTGLAALGYLALSPEVDRWWLRPLRRLRLRVLGHPLGHPSAAGRTVPVPASVELLETSLAWQAAGHLVKSSLLEHWTVDDSRVLRYAGRDAARPVTVLFTVDARASTSASRGTEVRVTVVDDETGDIVAEPPLRIPKIRPLPVA